MSTAIMVSAPEGVGGQEENIMSIGTEPDDDHREPAGHLGLPNQDASLPAAQLRDVR